MAGRPGGIYRPVMPDAEDISDYKQGGFHPVHLADYFKNGRYKILAKLGYGGWSTVWLARDCEASRYVALKIAVAEMQSENQEIQVLRCISNELSSAPGSQHVVGLLDEFQHIGPNGEHNCLALELLGPSVSEVISYGPEQRRLPSALARRVARETLTGLAFLHHLGIGHGDVHMRNIAFRLPLLDSLPEEEIISRLPSPYFGAVTRYDGGPLDEHVPSYQIESVSFPRDIAAVFTCSIKIIDFGKSFFDSTPPQTLHTPLSVRAPEVIFKDTIDLRVDLWSAGCVIFQLVTGSPPFDTSMATEHELVSQMMEFVNHLPERWSHKSSSMQDKNSAAENVYDMKRCLDICFEKSKTTECSPQDRAQLEALLRRLICMEPSHRHSADEVLEDEWFLTPQDVTS